MEKPQLVPLFAKWLYSKKLDIDRFNIDLSDIEFRKNHFNNTSVELHFLDKPNNIPLKTVIQQSVDEYFYKIMKVQNYTKIHITESWVNRSDNGQEHHLHTHSNSILSGILYLTEAKNTADTKFIDMDHVPLSFDVSEFNIWNSTEFSMSPEKGLLLLFPSNTYHKTGVHQADEPRFTLSFNTFITGPVSNVGTKRVII